MSTKKTNSLGERIKLLRKTEGLTQDAFANKLGIQSGYMSMLEKNKNKPSDVLLISISRTFNVSKVWLERGEGEMYCEQEFTPSGNAIIDETYRRIKSYPRLHSLNTIAFFMGFNPDKPSESLNMDDHYSHSITYLNEIFMEGDPRKIRAIMAQLEALRPPRRELDISRKKYGPKK